MPYSYEAMIKEIDDLGRDARHLTIVPDKLREVADAMRRELAAPGSSFQTDPLQYPNESPTENTRDTLQFYLVLTAQEFCIWRRNGQQVEAWDITIGGQRFVGARGIAAAHVRAIRQGKNILNPSHLASMTLEDVRDFYRDEATGQVTLQMLPQRLAKFNELGRVLLERYDGHAVNLLEESKGVLFDRQDQGLVQRLLLDFPTSYFDWPFNKLAVLYAKFLATRKTDGMTTTEEYRTLTRFRDPEHFVIAADYYIPLFFLRVGIFRVGDELGAHLRDKRLINRDSRMEREYRAATILAGRALAEASGHSVNAVDTECWKTGYIRCRLCREGISDTELSCPYRSISKGYQNDHALMEMRWPLVLTTCY